MQYARYVRYLKENRKLLIVGICAGAIAGLSSGFGVPFFVDRVFRKIFETTGTDYSTLYLIGISSLLPLIFLVRGISVYINQYFLQWVSQNMLREIRWNLFDKLQTLPVSYFERRQSGDLMAKLIGDTMQVQQAILLIAKDAFVQPFTFLAGFSYLIYLSIQQREAGFVLLLVILAPLIVLPVGFIGNKLKKRSRELQKTLGDLTDIMSENLRGITEVRSFNLQGKEKKRFRRQLDAYNRFAMKIAKYYHMTQPVMEFLAVTMVSLAFLYSYRQDVGFSTFASMGAALFFTVDAVKRLVKMVNGVQRMIGSFERIDSVLDEEDNIPEYPDAQPLSRVDGNIKFQDVIFRYEQDIALQVEDLEIPAGTTCALVGPSGAGKTTFARLIPRFYDPQQGTIYIDSHNIRHVRKHDLRDNIALVPQDPVLFYGTVADNIRLADENKSRKEVEKAAQDAYAEEFILTLPQGYDTLVGENAVRLSGGQRQRIALARAFLKDASVLILDEATSALDTESEIKIQYALREYAKNRTVIIIAHRFATIRLATRVFLFDNGRIRASGSIQELMKDELFRKLYENQATLP